MIMYNILYTRGGGRTCCLHARRFSRRRVVRSTSIVKSAGDKTSAKRSHANAYAYRSSARTAAVSIHRWCRTAATTDRISRANPPCDDSY